VRGIRIDILFFNTQQLAAGRFIVIVGILMG
jgi:hypothetical protein